MPSDSATGRPAPAFRARPAATAPPTAAELVQDLGIPGDSCVALEAIIPVIYAELRALAGRYLRRERRNHTLNPTGLVHEAYLRLVQQAVPWQNREQVIALAARMMRRILVDHARRKQAARRGGDRVNVTLAEDLVGSPPEGIDVLAVDVALQELARLDPRQARIVELRFFGGLTVEETAGVLGISTPTVKRDWQTARLFLRRELRARPSSDRS
ncbi:MAG TPA: ECF-type sigma factor [Thermoanaerobaculia bacterium]